MPGYSVKVTDNDIAAALGRVIEAGRDLTPLFDHLGPSLVGSTQQRFETETDPQGRKWIPLRPATIRAKRGDTRILRRRNILWGSLTFNVGPAFLAWGTNVAYAGIHQGGGTIEKFARSQKATFAKTRKGQMRFAKKRTKAKSRVVKPITIGAHSVTIPARPYLGIDAADKQLIIDEANAYLSGAWGAP